MVRKHERHERILQELKARPTVRILELAEEFGVTTETVRRDVDELSKKGLVDRTYGGAAVTPLGSEPKIDARATVFQEERTRIAKHALRLVAGDDVLMIDAGSTTTEFAARLAASIPDTCTDRGHGHNQLHQCRPCVGASKVRSHDPLPR